MKNNYKLMIFSLILLATNSLNAMETNEIKKHSNGKEIHKIEKSNKSVYVCPMHPNVISEEEGSCPICGMNLEKIENNKNKEIDIKVSSGIQQVMNIKTEKATMKLYRPKINTYGKVKYNENNINHFHSKIEGWVEDSKNYSVGDYIKKGDVLFKIYSPDLIVAQQDYLLTIEEEKRTKRYNKLVEKSEIRLGLLGMDDDQIKKLKKRMKINYRTEIHAKHSGYIKNISFKNGMYIKPELELLSIVDLSTVWIEGLIFDEKTNFLGAKIELEGTQNKIDYIYPEIEDSSQAIKFRSVINNKSNYFKIGKLYDIEIAAKTPLIGLFIPKIALIQLENEYKVIIKNKNKGFEVKNVKIGYINDNIVQIKEGLMKNDEVVISGQFLIDSEASLKSSIMKMEE